MINKRFTVHCMTLQSCSVGWRRPSYLILVSSNIMSINSSFILELLFQINFVITQHPSPKEKVVVLK